MTNRSLAMFALSFSLLNACIGVAVFKTITECGCTSSVFTMTTGVIPK